MEYEEFIELIQNKAEEHLGEAFTVSPTSVMKNNGICLKGIVITGQGEGLSPAFYLEDPYDEFLKGKEADQIVKEITDLYFEVIPKSKISLEFFQSGQAVREKVLFKLIHFDQNKELLQEVPYIRFLDLAVVFYVDVQDELMEKGSVLIYHSHMELWDMTVEELYQYALQNTPQKREATIQTMEDIMKKAMIQELQEKLGEEKDAAELLNDEFWKKNPEILSSHVRQENGLYKMYVLSNAERTYGAAAMLYPQVLQQFADQLAVNLYLLPSSVHEVILIPENGFQDREELLNMVKEVNDTQVAPGEILTYTVYYFDREKGKLAMI